MLYLGIAIKQKSPFRHLPHPLHVHLFNWRNN